MSGGRWQISAGELFELLRPAAWAISALLSACVLSDAQRRRLPLYSMAAWTLGTLLLPLIILPIYLIVRLAHPFDNRTMPDGTPDRAESQIVIEPEARSAAGSDAESAIDASATIKGGPSLAWKVALPLLYAALALALLALFYYRDYSSVDAHLARASRARLLDQPEQAIGEYRAALRLEENAHTRNLLAFELERAGQPDAALAEMRLALNGGEPDDTLRYRMARALDALGRRDEALHEYQSFLETRLCAQALPDDRCESARERMRADVR